MSAHTHLTLRDRRILAGVGKRRADVATPYVDRARVDAIVATEHARAIKREHEAERAGVSPELTARQALFQRYTRAKKTVGNALFSGAMVYVAAGALGMWLAVQPALDAATEARLTAEANAERAAQHLSGHTTVTLAGRPYDIARYSSAIAQSIAADQAKLRTYHASASAAP